MVRILNDVRRSANELPRQKQFRPRVGPVEVTVKVDLASGVTALDRVGFEQMRMGKFPAHCVKRHSLFVGMARIDNQYANLRKTSTACFQAILSMSQITVAGCIEDFRFLR